MTVAARRRSQATAKHRAECRRYRESSRGRAKRRAWWRRWISKPENRRAHNDRRRTLALRAAGVPCHGAVSLEGAWKIAKGRCALCGLKVPFPGYHDPDDPDAQATIDHIIPTSKGGSHSPRNARLAHMGCNRKRGAGECPAIPTSARPR